VRERSLYQGLIDRVESSVKDVMDVVLGKTIETDITRQTFESLQSNKTPPQWQATCYPSFSILTAFIENLLQRITYINGLIDSYSIISTQRKVIRKFKLQYFYDQRAFFTAFIQQTSRKTGTSMDKLKPKLRIMEKYEQMLTERLADDSNSYYLEGLWLNGATWNID